MSYIESFIVLGASCSKRSCTAEIRPKHLGNMHPIDARQRLREIAEPVGWSAWRGRSARLYCPQHGPTAAAIARGRITRVW